MNPGPDPSETPLVDGYRLTFDDEVVAEMIAEITGVLERGQLTLGPVTVAFEALTAEMAGTNHAIAVNSGTTALESVLVASGLAGTEVLIPTNTNFGTAIAVLRAGAIPVLYDNDIDPDLLDVERHLSPATSAVIAVHIGGYVSTEVENLRALCHDHGYFLLEDDAHAHGASLGHHLAGSIGDAGAFSFFPTKLATTGEGGVVTTDDPDLAAKVRTFRDQGKDASGQHVMLGTSGRLTELGAAIGIAQLTRLASRRAALRDVARRYRDGLSDIEWITFPWEDGPATPSGHKIVGLLNPTVDPTRLYHHLSTKRIRLAGSVYSVPLHRQPVFVSLDAGHYPRAEDFARRHVCLPLYEGLGPDDIDRVLDAFRSALR